MALLILIALEAIRLEPTLLMQLLQTLRRFQLSPRNNGELLLRWLMRKQNCLISWMVRNMVILYWIHEPLTTWHESSRFSNSHHSAMSRWVRRWKQNISYPYWWHLSKTILLSNVLFVPNLNCSLISVSKLLRQTNYFACFTGSFHEDADWSRWREIWGLLL